jgi:acetyltransferase-like isoleucine patch superfamily enzyme
VELFAAVGDDVEVELPFHCDYGGQITVGAGVYVNVGCVVLDCTRVEIGDRALLGPGVHLYAATHPVDPAVRRSGCELAAPVTIGTDVWLGGGVHVYPGVTVGAGTTTEAGSVVTRDVPPGVVAAGNPCRRPGAGGRPAPTRARARRVPAGGTTFLSSMSIVVTKVGEGRWSIPRRSRALRPIERQRSRSLE